MGALAEARLLTTGKDEATGEPVVNVTHEALIRGWPELRAWINDDREQLRLHRRLSDAAADWDAGGRDDGQLYRGAPLAVWEGRDESDLNELERGFLSSSRERVERERETRRRRTRITIGALAGVAAIIAGIAVFAFVQRGEATSQRDVARSRQLASSALLQLPTDPELSLLLAERAYETDDTPEAEEVLRQATFDSRIRAASHDHTADVNAVAYTARAGTVASADGVGDLQIWNPRTGDTQVVATGQGIREGRRRRRRRTHRDGRRQTARSGSGRRTVAPSAPSAATRAGSTPSRSPPAGERSPAPATTAPCGSGAFRPAGQRSSGGTRVGRWPSP